MDVDEIGQYTQFHWGTDQRDEYLTDLDQCRHHLVFYRVVTGGIEILRVLHVARDVQNLLTDPGR